MSAAIVTDLRMRTSASTSRPYAWMALAAMSVFVLIGMGPVLQRGPWLDEFWTLWLSAHDAPLAEIFWQRWMADLHPPLFSLMHWLAEPWAGDSYVRHRMLNLVPLAWCALLVGLVLRRHPAAAPMVCVFLVCFLSLPVMTEYFAEMRSYFSLMCLLFALLGCVMVIHGAEHDLDRAHDLPLLVFTGVTVVVSLNLNYIGTAVSGLVGAAAVVAFALTGKRRWAVALVGLMAVAMIPLVGLLVIQQRVLSDAAANYWVSGTLSDALLTIRRTVKRGVVANPVALLAVGLVLAGAAVQALRGRAIEAAPAGWWKTALGHLRMQRRQVQLVLLLGVAGAGFSAFMLLAHLQQPIVTGRYLLGLQVVAAGVVAVLCSHLVARRWTWVVAMLVVAALGQHATSREVAAEPRWRSSFELMQRELANCASAEVFAAEFPRTAIMANETAARRFGQVHMARWHGIDAKFVEPGPSGIPARAEACPALVWVEHVNWNVMPRDASPSTMLSRIGFDAAPFDMARARAEVGDTGFVLVLPVKP